MLDQCGILRLSVLCVIQCGIVMRSCYNVVLLCLLVSDIFRFVTNII